LRFPFPHARNSSSAFDFDRITLFGKRKNPMAPVEPVLKIRSDRFEVRQGSGYVSIDRARVDAVHYHAGVLSVRYKENDGIELDCAKIEPSDLKSLLHTLQAQRDRNHERARNDRNKNSASILPNSF